MSIGKIDKQHQMGSGKILFFLQRRGFGFIIPDGHADNHETNIFYGTRSFHYIDGYDKNQQDEMLQEKGVKVCFEAELEPKGMRAEEVHLAQEELDKIGEEENEDAEGYDFTEEDQKEEESRVEDKG